MFKKFLLYLFNITIELNEKSIISFLEYNPGAKLLDLGCDDGEMTVQFADKVKTKNIYGIEVIKKRAELAQDKGIDVWIGDLNEKWKIKSNSIDVLVANQIIEHISDIDHFISEIKRVLRRGGYAIVSTENGSSWHNIFASIMGWQIFSSTNISSRKLGIGNPLALLKNKKLKYHTWTHKTIFYYQGLKEIMEAFGFSILSYRGCGYHPLPPELGYFDARHAHFLTIKIRKN